MKFNVGLTPSAEDDLDYYQVRERRIILDMKTIDLSRGRHSLSKVLAAAKTETVLLHLSSGEEYLLEHADEFDREVAALGRSEKFTSFLEARAKETGRIPLREVRRRRGL